MSINTINIPSGVKAAFVIVILLLLAVTGAFFFITGNQLDSVRVEMLKSLHEMEGSAKVFIDGNPVQSPQRIIEDLGSIRPHRAHHSHPEERFVVRVVSQTNSVVLELGRDSEIRTEYWVFNPKLSVFEDSIIGSFQTDALSKYPIND